MAAINRFDGSILLWIQAHLRGVLNAPVIFITHLGDGGAFWIALTLILVALPRTRRLGLTCAIALAVGSLFTDVILKHWIARTRPYEVFAGLERLIEAQKDFSFPSGHTTCSLACSWTLFRRAPRRLGVPALILAAAISLSRLYVGVHYPTDILGGAAVGLGSSALALRLAGRTKLLRT